MTSKSSVEGKLIYNVKVHSDLSPPEYDTLARHKRYLYSISEVSESSEQIPFCTGVSLTAICILTAAHCMQKYEKANNYTKLRVANNKKSHEVLTSESHVDYKTGFSEFTDICIVTVIFLANFSRCHHHKKINKYYQMFSKIILLLMLNRTLRKK